MGQRCLRGVQVQKAAPKNGLLAYETQKLKYQKGQHGFS
jgi:hypothetical protein